MISGIIESFPSLQTLFFTLFSSLVLIVCVRIKWFKIHSGARKNLPPSPRGLPIIGNLHQLGSNPNQSLQALSRKHGSLMLLHLGSVPTLVASSSQAAEEILKTHDLALSSRPSSPILEILLYGCKDLAFAPSGEFFKQIKSTVATNLLSTTQVKSFRSVREKEIGQLVHVLGESYGSSVDISALFFSLAEKIVCTVAIGRTYDGLKLTSLLKTYLTMFTRLSVGRYIPSLSWVDRITGLMGSAEKVTKQLDEFLENIIEEKKRGKLVRNNERQDFIDIMLNVQKDNTAGFTLEKDTIKSVILDIFGGGIDSASTNMEWVMSELVRNPRVMKNLQKEIIEVAQGRSTIVEEDLERMPYLKAIVKESLRLHPPVPLLLPHQSTQDVKLMGYDIPSRTHVLVNVWEIGRDSTLWDEPLEFRPERFLTNSINYKGNNFQWLPFGAGRRMCPGVMFSVAIIELVIANIVCKFDLALPNGVQNEDLDMTEKFGITVHRKFPLLVNASPRF